MEGEVRTFTAASVTPVRALSCMCWARASAQIESEVKPRAAASVTPVRAL